MALSCFLYIINKLRCVLIFNTPQILPWTGPCYGGTDNAIARVFHCHCFTHLALQIIIEGFPSVMVSATTRAL